MKSLRSIFHPAMRSGFVTRSLCVLAVMLLLAPPELRAADASLRVAFNPLPVEFGTVDANTATYIYAPAFVYDSGRYHYFVCSGVAGDFIQYKSATTLAGLAAIPMRTVLQPFRVEQHNCDPSVVKGDDGRWYLHYSNTPINPATGIGTSTGAGVAVADKIDGPYAKMTTNLLGTYAVAGYGRGQTTVAKGPDGFWYMAFTNQIEPLEPNSIVVLRSADASFTRGYTEVTRFNAGLIGGWSAQLSWDPRRRVWTFLTGNNLTTTFDAAFNKISQTEFPLPAGALLPGEGQAFLVDAKGQLVYDTPNARGLLISTGATQGPARGGLPTWITGPNQWRSWRVTNSWIDSDFNADAIPDVWAIKRNGSTTEIHVLDGKNPGIFLNQKPTGLHPTNGDWEFSVADYNGDGVPDLWAINKKDPQGYTALHIIDGANPNSFLLHTLVGLHQTNALWTFKVADYNGDGTPDLWAFNRNDPNGNKTAIHVYDGKNFNTALLHTLTAVGDTSDLSRWDLAVADYNADGTPDLWLIDRRDASGWTAAHVVNGKKPNEFLLHTLTSLHNTDANWMFNVADYNRDGKPDLWVVNRSDYGAARTSLHVMNGNNLNQFLLHSTTALGITDSNFIFIAR